MSYICIFHTIIVRLVVPIPIPYLYHICPIYVLYMYFPYYYCQVGGAPTYTIYVLYMYFPSYYDSVNDVFFPNLSHTIYELKPYVCYMCSI